MVLLTAELCKRRDAGVSLESLYNHCAGIHVSVRNITMISIPKFRYQ